MPRTVADIDLGDVPPEQLIETARVRGCFVFDLETTGLNPKRDRIEGVAFYVPEGPENNELRAWYPFVPHTMRCWVHPDETPEEQAARLKYERTQAREDHEKWVELRQKPEFVSLRPALRQEETMEALRPLFEDSPDVYAIAHNAKFDVSFLRYASGCLRRHYWQQISAVDRLAAVGRGDEDDPGPWGFATSCRIADSMQADFLRDENFFAYGLKGRVKQVFNHDMVTYTDVIKRRNQGTFGFMSEEVEALGTYAMSDCYWTWRLFEHALNDLNEQTPGGLLLDDPVTELAKLSERSSRVSPFDRAREMGTLERIYWNIDMKITLILEEMESRGVLIDWAWLKQVTERLEEKKDKIIDEIEKHLGYTINPNSSPQVSTVLFADPPTGLGIPTKGIKRGKSGLYSTGSKEIAHLSGAHPVVKLILDWRSADTIQANFSIKLAHLAAEERDNRCYSHFNQTGTKIHRLSSSDPINLQNLPRDRDLIRRAVCATLEEDLDPGLVLLGADYGQIELRVAAHFCLHRTTHVYLADGTSEEIGKIVNQKIAADAVSYDFSTESVVHKPIVAHYRNNAPVDESKFRDGTTDWWVVRHSGAPDRRLIITSEHRVFRPDGRKVRVADLEVGSLLLHHEPHLENDALQVFLGCLLGDSNIKNAYSSKDGSPTRRSVDFYNGPAQRDYFNLKTKVLLPFISNVRKDNQVMRAHIRSSEIVHEWTGRALVDGRRRPTPEIIKKLEPLGLAIWYMDDGSIKHDPRCREAAGWSCVINRQNIGEEVRDAVNKRFGLQFSCQKKGLGVSGAKADCFFDLIAPFVPPCMAYKLPPKFRGRFEPDRYDVIVSPVTPVSVIERRRPEIGEALFRKSLTSASFDITVADTHNYFAQGVLVSNSGDKGMIEVYNMTGGCKAAGGEPCERYKHWECDECGNLWIPAEESPTKCAKCGDAKIGHQKRCRHVDLHQRTAEDVSIPRNPLAKNCNFGNLYRIGPERFCQYANLYDAQGNPRVDYAREVLGNWYEAYPAIEPFQLQIEEMLRTNGWIAYTITGRQRRLNQERYKNDYRAVTQGIQFTISGSAQDILKISMVRIWEEKWRRVLNTPRAESRLWERFRFLLQVHDEIVCECPIELADEAAVMIKEKMEGAAELRVPLVTDVKRGRTWDNIH